MADITAVGEENPSPTQDELQQAAGNGAADNRTPKRRMSDDEEDEEKTGRERRKIEIKFIQDKSRRHITFSKRKAGIMKKVWPYSGFSDVDRCRVFYLYTRLILVCSLANGSCGRIGI